MPNNQGISNAQLQHLNAPDPAVAAFERGDVFRVGTVDPPATIPSGTEMWFGTGNLPTNYNLTDDPALGYEQGLKVHIRQGADLTPTASGANGMQTYAAPAGSEPTVPTRAAWNIDYAINTDDSNVSASAAGSLDLAQMDFLLQVTASGASYGSGQTAVFAFNAADHVWSDVNNPAVGFGGDDFSPPKGASASIMQHIAENSINVAFLQGDFGPLAQETAPGVTWDFKLGAYHAGSPSLEALTHTAVVLGPAS